MTFREKAKALFRSRPRSDTSSKSSSKDSGRDRWPSNVYKPGEPMPRPKYRNPPKKEHKEKLEAFSFADAWRRNSSQSQYSPMGTRAPSRSNSFMSMIRRQSAGSARSRSLLSVSRNNSVTSGDTDKAARKTREGRVHRAAKPTDLNTEVENEEGDDDVANVGLSRVHSIDWGSGPRPVGVSAVPPVNGFLNSNSAIPLSLDTAVDHEPFTEHDLTLAMKRSNLAVAAQ